MAETAVETPATNAAATNDKLEIAAEEAAAASITDQEKLDLEAKAADKKGADDGKDGDVKTKGETPAKDQDSCRRTLKPSDAANFVASLGKRLTLGRRSGAASEKKAAALAADDEQLRKGDKEKSDEVDDADKEGKVKEVECSSPSKAASPPPPAVHKKDFEQDIVYVYQFSRTPVLPSVSSFCLKLETWLKLQGIKYENVDHQNKLRSKRGLLPFVEINGEEINESDVIIETLGNKFEKNLDANMAAQDENVQHAMIAMVDNHLNWCYTHWSVRDVGNTIRGYKVNLQDMMHSVIPSSMLMVIMKYTYIRRTNKRLKAAGFGYFSDAEVDAMGEKDLRVLSELLGEKDYFFGSEPRTLDLKVFVWLAIILCVDDQVDCPLRTFMHADCSNLVALFNRIKDRAWGAHWEQATGDSLDMNPHIPKPEPVEADADAKQDEVKTDDDAKDKSDDKKEVEEQKKADEEAK